MKLSDIRFWRIVAIALGASLMLGETIRSWGQGRHLLFVLDDFFVGFPLVVSGLLMARPTVARRCAFSASFAAAAGMLYPSFFSKVLQPAAPVASSIGRDVLTALIGGAFLLSLLGLIASLLSAMPQSERQRNA